MADTKITALTALTAADPANDVIPIVDVSDTSMAASGTTKKISVNNILGASGTATLASATITGAATVGTTLGVTGVSTLASAVVTGDLTARTTGLTVNSSGVGVGTSSQSSFLGNSPKRLVIGDGTQTPALTLYGGSAVVSGIYFADGTVGNEAYRGFIEYDHATDAFNFGTGGTSAITVNSSRNLAFLDGKGIDFSATASGSGTMTSELLADYEEGTWTGTLKGSVSDPTIAVTATGAYTKVGRLVTVTIGYSNVLTTGASGNVTITGLPFSGAASSAGSVITFDMFTTSTTLACWNTGTTIAFYVSGGFVPATHNAGASRSVTVTMTYYV